MEELLVCNCNLDCCFESIRFNNQSLFTIHFAIGLIWILFILSQKICLLMSEVHSNVPPLYHNRVSDLIEYFMGFSVQKALHFFISFFYLFWFLFVGFWGYFLDSGHFKDIYEISGYIFEIMKGKARFFSWFCVWINMPGRARSCSVILLLYDIYEKNLSD